MVCDSVRGSLPSVSNRVEVSPPWLGSCLGGDSLPFLTLPSGERRENHETQEVNKTYRKSLKRAGLMRPCLSKGYL